jgi:hypothetical protein
MRFLTPAVAAVLFAAQVSPGIAQTTPPATAPATTPPAASPPAAPPPVAATPGTTVPETTAPPPPAPETAPPPKPHKPRRAAKRMTMRERFEAANTTQDGHLTLDQARAAHWPYVVRNFAAIDRGHKGYITEADIHAFAHARYLARHAAAAPPPPGAPPPPPPPTPAPMPAAPPPPPAPAQ